MRNGRPNILIAVLDSTRPELLSCYSGPPQTTPNIDRLAEQAYVFETAISPSAHTWPVTASVFTGMLPSKHGGHDEHFLLDSPYRTMAEIFSQAGYDTAAFVDESCVGPRTRLDRGFRVMSNLRRHQVTLRNQLLKMIGRAHRELTRAYQKTCETRVLIGEALHWLRRRWDRCRPFLLYVHTDETHMPLLPPARFRRRFTRLNTRRMRAINQDKELFVAGVARMCDADFGNLHDLARAEAAFFDEWFGRLLRYLERERAMDDTVVVVMGDHGDNYGDHGLIRHGLCLYDTLLRVPLILRPPGARAGTRIRPMVQTIDLLPTLMDLASIAAPEVSAELQGSDLLEQVQTGRYTEFAISESYRPVTGGWERKVPHFMPEWRTKYDRVLRSYRTNTHKCIWSSNGRHELYDLVRDPCEERNLVDEEPQLARELHSRLQAWLASFPHAHAGAPVAYAAAEDERWLAPAGRCARQPRSGS